MSAWYGDAERCFNAHGYESPIFLLVGGRDRLQQLYRLKTILQRNIDSLHFAGESSFILGPALVMTLSFSSHTVRLHCLLVQTAGNLDVSMFWETSRNVLCKCGKDLCS